MTQESATDDIEPQRPFHKLFERSFPNVLYEPPKEFKAGAPTDFAVGEVDERFKSSHGVWIVREESGLYALSAICTTLGVTPNWHASEQEFVCPHCGSRYATSGVNVAGPSPRPLERFKIALGEDGQITVDRRVKFQHEKGQWDAEGAFLLYP